MLESTRVRNRVLTPYFILPLGTASFTVDREQPKVNEKTGKMIVDTNNQPIIEKVSIKQTANWGVLFLKRDINVAYFISSQDELKLVAITDDTPFLNVMTNQVNKIDHVPFSIIDKLSQFLTDPNEVINNCNLSTLVKSGFISYEFQRDNVLELLADYCNLNGIVEIDTKTIDTIISRDNAQRMGIIHSNFQLHDQLPRLIADHSNSVNLSSDNKAVTMEARSQTIDYLNTSSRTNDQNVKTVENTESLQAFDQGVTNGNGKTAKTAK